MTDATPTDRAPGPRGDRIAALVALALDEPDRLPDALAAASVAELAEVALRLPAARRLELLLHHSRPLRLVRALPAADFYLTVREVGPVDALPLLARAAPEQLVHLLDLEAWRRDRFDAARAGAWVAVLLEAGEPPLRRLLRHADDELLALLCQRWMGIEPRDGDETDDEHPGSTPDGAYRFAPSISAHAPAIRRILRLLLLEQPERYRRLLWQAQWELGAELEEQALRWRLGRLEEHGFPSWEEALATYDPPSGAPSPGEPPLAPDADLLGASRGVLMVLPPHRPLVAAIDALAGAARERALFELAALANRLLVADAADAGDPAAHRAAIENAAGYVTVALESRAHGESRLTAAALAATPVLELFRAGYARAAELGTRALRLVREGWAASHPQSLALLDAPIRAQVEALLEPRPSFVPVEPGPEPRPRPFRSGAELELARAALETAEVIGEILVGRLGLDVTRLSATAASGGGERTFGALLLTVMAWQATRQELRGEPLPADVAADFLRSVASRRTAGPAAAPRALERLVRRLGEACGLGTRETAVLEAYGRFCLERLAAECGDLDPGVPLDRRAVTCLLLA